nr:hypothetical protein [Tanacetum cinerariifolium]
MNYTKFNDGTLNDVRTTLDDRLKGSQMQYLPQTIWRRSDKDRAAAMIQAIDKQLKTRRSEAAKYDEQDNAEGGGDDEEEGESDEEDDHEEIREEENFDPIPKTPEGSEDEGDGKEDQGLNIGEEERHNEEEEADELYRDVDINQGRGLHVNQEVEDSHVILTPINSDGQQKSSLVSSQFVTNMMNPTSDAGMESIFTTASTSVATLPITAPTMTPSTVTTITTTSQAPIPPTLISSEVLQNLPYFESVFRFDDRLRSLEQNFSEVMQTTQFATLEANFSEFMQSNQFARAISSIPRIVQRYMDQRMNEAVKVAVQIQSDHLHDEAQAENDEFLKTIDENMQKIIKEDTVTLKRRCDDDADKDKEPSTGSERGSKRRREGKEPESASAPKEKATRSASKSTQGSKSLQTSASESATAEEPMQTTFEMEEPSHLEFETGADDQPTVEPSQHSECIQSWISKLAKQSDSRSSFNDLMDTPVDFFAFLINRLKVDTLTSKLIAGPNYELMKGSRKSLVKLKFFLEEVYKARTNQIDWVNPKVTELKIVEWHNYKHLDWITVRRDDDKLYKFKEGDFKRLRIQDIEDMLLLLVQGKLTNLTVEERFACKKHRNPKACGRPSTRCRKLPEEAQPYMAGYTIWRKSDKERAAAMIQAIDKMLKTMRIMRSLERFVGGRMYKGDFRML